MTIENNRTQNHAPNDSLTRKEWLKKTGKYAAFTAASMMMVLSPGRVSAQDSSPAIPPPPPPVGAQQQDAIQY